METPDYLPILSAGNHPDPTQGACFMEFASYLAGEEWSDHPKCANPFLTAVSITVNDAVNSDTRQLLLPLIPRVIGTDQWNDDQTVYDGMRTYGRTVGLPTQSLPGNVSYETWAMLASLFGSYLSIPGVASVVGLTAVYDEFDRLAGREPVAPVTVEQYTAYPGRVCV